MTAFLHRTENTKNIFSRSKSRNKNPGHVFFLNFILLFNIAVEKFGKKIIWSGALEGDFSKLRISRVRVQISEIW